ncbi:sulfatase family protein [Echinicola pacifica]|nr:sulfatase [Echinicola pacifica]
MRKFSIWAFIGLLCLCGWRSEGNAQQVSKGKSPNIIFILTDDQGAHLSALGTKGLQTPNLDQLAHEGVLFTNSFASVASCSPSRSSIMTGMYPHANGHWRNTVTPRLSDADQEFGRQSSTVDKVGVHEYVQTLPEVLKANNYYTAITQKFHMSPPWKFPYSDRNPVSNDPEEFRKVIAQFIEDSETGNQPFFIQANISPPHRNFDHHMSKFPQYMADPDDIEVPAYLPDTPEMRKDLSKYFGCIQLADACVGAIVELLQEKGIYEETLIIYTSDQGEPYHRAKASPYYAGMHVPLIARGPEILQNIVQDELISHIDIMPTILDYAGLPIPSTVQGSSLLGILENKVNTGPQRQYIFAEHNSHGPPRAEHYPSRAVFDGQFYYILNLMPDKDYLLPADLQEQKVWGNQSYTATEHAEELFPEQYAALRMLESGRPAEELYNMNTDPGQLNNLAQDKDYESKLEELRSAMKEWRKNSGDDFDDPLDIPTRLGNP